MLRGKKKDSHCATPFRALRTAAGRWVAEEGHGDPSQACICLMPADSAVQKDLDTHLGGIFSDCEFL
jgi:hypothetical protein